MNKFDRIYELSSLLRANRYPVSLRNLAERLECSPSTVKRLIAKCRDELNFPIRYDAKANGYILDKLEAEQHEVPGLWFPLSELQALLATHELLSRLQPGMLKSEFSLFRDRIESILTANSVDTNELNRRFRVLGVGARSCLPEFFKLSASATLQRFRLQISYHGREKDNISTRTISPQRLVYYRENWYLDAWCHQKNGFRTLALDRFKAAKQLNERAIDIPDEDLDEQYTEAYGIFSGRAHQIATLLFSPTRSRWVSDEQWHPQQKGSFTEDGSYRLQIPFSDPRELLLDILRYGPEVEVLSPASLRREVKLRLEEALKKYQLM